MQLGDVTLRPDQDDTIRRARAAVARCQAAGVPARVLIVGPCGFGKTITSSALMAGALEKGFGSMFLASGVELIRQKSRTLDRCRVEHGVLMGEEEYYPSQVVVASKETYHGRVFRHGTYSPEHRRLVVVDEAHLAMGSTWMQCFDSMPAETVFIGLTATPILGDGRGMGAFWKEMVIAATYSQLIGNGTLVEPRIIAPWTIDTNGLGKAGEDWSQPQVEKRFNEKRLVGDIVENYIKHGGERPFACFSSGVDHSIALTKEFNERGIRCEHIDGETPKGERETAFRAVESGDLRGLCNFGVLGTGFDLPILGCGILAFASDSRRKVIQVCGRMLRAHPSKRDCILIDHGGNVYRHGWPTADCEWSLDPNETIKEREAKRQAANPSEPREPICCPKCSTMRDKGRKCLACGHEHKRNGMKVKTVDGVLKELKPKDVKKAKQADDGNKLWMQCLAAMAYRGGTISAARVLYKQKMGHWPDAYDKSDYSERNMKVAVRYPGFIKRKKDDA
jgi:DNA repair protein RadD